jgi:purine-binding chemotaxis protein CheW
MIATSDVVEFELGGELYAMDIMLAREIVEMMPITPLPKSPDYIAGIMNLRGEITTILSINTLLGIKDHEVSSVQKIIVLVPEVANGSNVGIIVDDVHSVITVSEHDIEQMDTGLSADINHFVKGIIKFKVDDEKIKKTYEGDHKKSLMIWVDIQKLLKELIHSDVLPKGGATA